VLIVDPDEAARDLYGNWFTSMGYTVMCAAAVDGACWAVKRHRPDVIVTELALRRSTGVELLRALHRPFEPPIPVLVMTRSTDRALMADARDAGAVAVVPKHTGFDELHTWVRALTEWVAHSSG
jgi:DNA-binding response OmpR family regulator